MLIRTVQNPSSALKRGLALLLLAFIFYGTTVEAAHRHGRTLPFSASAASVVAPNSGSGNLNTTQGCNDCLICQLHQNFSATLISIKPTVETVTLQQHLRRTDPVSIRWTTTRPASGRAPPQAN